MSLGKMDLLSRFVESDRFLNGLCSFTGIFAM